MTDLVKRLREPVTVEREDGIRLEAADNIEKLREAVNMLRVANSTLRSENAKLGEMLKDYERVYDLMDIK